MNKLTDQLYSIVDMKSQLVILLILVSSLLATNADQQCDNLLQQYNQKCIRFTAFLKFFVMFQVFKGF